MLVESWKFRCQQQCLVKLHFAEVEGKPVAPLEDTRQNTLIDEAEESMRIRMEGAPHRYHEDQIAGKGMNLLSHYNLVRKFIHKPQAMKIPDAKAAVEKIMGKTLRQSRHGS